MVVVDVGVEQVRLSSMVRLTKNEWMVRTVPTANFLVTLSDLTKTWSPSLVVGPQFFFFTAG